MLSINIPVYNVYVSALVKEVNNQAQQAGIDYEIRVYDDCSEEKFRLENRKLGKLTHVKYQEMPENLGRSAIRNKMGLDSDKRYLLFIDSDSMIDLADYIRNYLIHMNPGCVICGGTKYDAKPPNQESLLRWVYGNAREAIPAKVRNSHKGFIITSNNFLIDRNIFKRFHFRENIGPYGHEDTLLGYDLFCNGIFPSHIDNPVIHQGLEDSFTFLDKTKNALGNLMYIEEKIVQNDLVFRQQMRFLQQYKKVTHIVPTFLLRLLFRIFKNRIEINLTGRNPKLLLFDLYKAGYYALLKYGN